MDLCLPPTGRNSPTEVPHSVQVCGVMGNDAWPGAPLGPPQKLSLRASFTSRQQCHKLGVGSPSVLVGLIKSCDSAFGSGKKWKRDSL